MFVQKYNKFVSDNNVKFTSFLFGQQVFYSTPTSYISLLTLTCYPNTQRGRKSARDKFTLREILYFTSKRIHYLASESAENNGLNSTLKSMLF